MFDNKSIQLSWSKPNFTCPHKYLINRQIEPNITSPRNFSIGRHEIKYIFEMYGGMKVICTIVFNVRLCRKYYLYIFHCMFSVRDRLLILEWGRGGAVGEKPLALYFFLRSPPSAIHLFSRRPRIPYRLF